MPCFRTLIGTSGYPTPEQSHDFVEDNFDHLVHSATIIRYIALQFIIVERNLKFCPGKMLITHPVGICEHKPARSSSPLN